MKKKWVILEEKNNVPKELIDDISNELGFPELFSKILILRDLDTPEKAREFIFSNVNDFHDPFKLNDMEEAVERIIDAIKSGQKIRIYGDYDVDGITSVALLYSSLKKMKANIDYYIPNRLSDGYGINKHGIDLAYGEDIDLLISVDCGISAVDEVEYAKTLGIDVIITDHHTPREIIPKAVAVINPKRVDDDYPFKELAGVGVAFKLLQALISRSTKPTLEKLLEENLDIVALGTIADIVSLTGENRIIAKYGLKRLQKSKKSGIRALNKSTGLVGKQLNTGHVIFVLAPRLNAVGRLGHAELGVKILLAQNDHEARTLAKELNENNQDRREIDNSIYIEAKKKIDSDPQYKLTKSIVLASDTWHSGVTGIVASRIVEAYYKPSIMIAVEEGIGKGSARSIAELDILEAIKNCSEYLEDFGGHKYAAGLTILEENIKEFTEKFENNVVKMLEGVDTQPTLYVDASVQLNEINLAFIKRIKELAPYGPDNLPPILVVENATIVGEPQIVGNNHLKLTIKKNQHYLKMIGFGMSSYFDKLYKGQRGVDIAFIPEENNWLGSVTVQGRIKDIRITTQ